MNTAKMQYNINLLLDPLEQEFSETKTSQPRVLWDFRLGPSQKGAPKRAPWWSKLCEFALVFRVSFKKIFSTQALYLSIKVIFNLGLNLRTKYKLRQI